MSDAELTTRLRALARRLPWTPARLQRVLGRLRRGGVAALRDPAADEQRFDDYAAWARARERADRQQLRALRRIAGRDARWPVFHIVCCAAADAGNAAPTADWLAQARASVEAQTYPRWRWLDDDALPISASAPQWVLLLQPGERLAADALLWLAEAIVANADWQWLYTDSDAPRPDDGSVMPLFKPDWSPDLAVQPEYPGGVLAFCSTHWTGGDAATAPLRWLEQALYAERGQVGHVARVLCHRQSPVAHAVDAAVRARAEHVLGANPSLDTAALQVSAASGRLCAVPMVPPGTLVSIIIPLRDNVAYLRDCIDSIVARTTGVDYELIIVDNGSVETETLTYLAGLPARDDLRARVVRADVPFNWSLVNNLGAAEAAGSVLLFLNNDTEVIDPDWLARLAGHALRPEIGVVGGLLLYPDRTVQHAGVVVGMNHWADHVGAGLPPNGFAPDSPAMPVAITRNVLAVTGACLCVARFLYDQLGGLDERFLICGSDIAFGLEAWRAGRFNLLCAEARLVHHESKTRSRDVPAIDFTMSALCYEPWRTQAVDPFHNRNLALFDATPRMAVRRGGR